MNSVPTAAPTPASEAWTAWKCMSTPATAVGPAPLAYRATAPTAQTSMRWVRTLSGRAQKAGVRELGEAQEGGVNVGQKQRNPGFRRGWRPENTYEKGGRQVWDEDCRATQGRSWENGRGILRGLARREPTGGWGWDQSIDEVGEGRPANRETRNSGPGITGRGLTSSRLVPSVLTRTLVSRAPAASTPCLASTVKPVPEATKAHGCLVWASTTPGLANRSGWVESVDKRSWLCRGGGLLGWMRSPCDKWDEAPGSSASFALVFGLGFMSMFKDKATPVLSPVSEETHRRSGSTQSLPLQVCNDIDECNDGNNGGCDPNSICTNTVVS